MITASTENKALKGIIDFYYFHSSQEKGITLNYSYFPNFKNALTIYNGSKMHFEKSKAIITPAENELTIAYSTNFYSKIDVSINGPFSKIGIVFHPLGINHFIDKDLNKIHSGETKSFTEFGPEFNTILHRVFLETDIQAKVKILDDYFSKHIRTFENPVKKSIESILLNNGNIKVSDLAQQQGINRKTLLRYFKSHLTCSIEEYKKMVKFRMAFNSIQQLSNSGKLIQIALENEYYDQADFSNQFKELTKSSPKKLQPKLKKFGDKGTYWAVG